MEAITIGKVTTQFCIVKNIALHPHTPLHAQKHAHVHALPRHHTHTHTLSFPLFNVHTVSLSHTHTDTHRHALTCVAPKKIFLFYLSSFSLFSHLSPISSHYKPFLSLFLPLFFLSLSSFSLCSSVFVRTRWNVSFTFHSNLFFNFFPFFWQLEERKEEKTFCSFPSFVCLIADNLFPAFCWI